MINYLTWADHKMFGVLKTLASDHLNKEYPMHGGSIHSRLIHIAEEYLAWLYDIQQKNWSSEIEKYKQMDSYELIEQIEDSHLKWLEYIQSPPTTVYTIQEGKDLFVEVTLNEVVFNLVNHASYHRGQIATLLRMMEFEVPTTDWYWYRISLLTE